MIFEDHSLISIGKEEYIKYFTEAFGEFEPSHLPGIITIMSDDEKKRIAFASWYRHNASTIYLQYVGFINGAEKRFSYWAKMVDYLIGKGSVLGCVDNKNKMALIWALRQDFKIIGVRMPTNGSLLVEVLKEA